MQHNMGDWLQKWPLFVGPEMIPQSFWAAYEQRKGKTGDLKTKPSLWNSHFKDSIQLNESSFYA